MIKDKVVDKKTLSKPKIYGYTDKTYPGLIKVGYTTIGVKDRVKQQYPTKRPDIPYKIILEESAIREDGTTFIDHDVFYILRSKGIPNPEGEWFRCKPNDIKAAINQLRKNSIEYENRVHNFKLRPDQKKAIQITSSYFKKQRKMNPKRDPSFLWNAKMRFGKTFTTYKLAEEMGWKKILILTYKPAVENSWKDDLNLHVDFKDWIFISKINVNNIEDRSKKKIVCFGSFQDYLGKNKLGGIKSQNEWVHETNWDCIVFDEYHYGAWRTNAKDLCESEDSREAKAFLGESIDTYNKDTIPITSDHYLYLSGTPFKAITSGEFTEDQIFNWTYGDEQKAKLNWKDKRDNPYADMPKMVMMTYEVPKSVSNIALQGEFNEFDLNTFFKAEGEEANAKFIYEEYVQKWLDLIRGAHLPTTVDSLKMGASKPLFPFSAVELRNVLNHTFWFLPNVSACYAMNNLLQQKQNIFYHDYKIIIAAGKKAGIGSKALPPLRKAMYDPLSSKTITLSCMKLTTGVTVRPWTGILMLRNTVSPETYFQAAFRVQSAWTIDNPDNLSPNKKEIIKNVCYVFDFATHRALRQISDYSSRLYENENMNPIEKVREFINFLPVISYDGTTSRERNASEILDLIETGTSGNLLAKKWQSILLVNVDNDTLEKILNNSQAMEAIMKIEGFRSLNKDIEAIISLSKDIKEIKNEGDVSNKKELDEKEKESKNKRKMIREKLIKFATRIPIFMYLTDYREQTLIDVIKNLEPSLFTKVTGLTIKDFELLLNLNLFNKSLMDEAVYKFKVYEDSSLNYSGTTKHDFKDIGLWDTVIKNDKQKFT